MSVQLNHTIVWCRDRQKSAAFLTGILGLPDATTFGPFLVVPLSNDVSLDFGQREDEISSTHYAFLLSEAEFDAVFARICERGLRYWADPYKEHVGEINHRDGGRGIYFDDPDGHVLEILTRPYGSGAT